MVWPKMGHTQIQLSSFIGQTGNSPGCDVRDANAVKFAQVNWRYLSSLHLVYCNIYLGLSYLTNAFGRVNRIFYKATCNSPDGIISWYGYMWLG